MAPESRNNEVRIDVHCQAMNMQATIESLPLLCNGAVNMPSQQKEAVFFV
jgi:hypothetical protein